MIYYRTFNGWKLPVLASLNQLMETSGARLCPAIDDVFRALSYFRPEGTKVIILGQDPYHSVDQYGNKKAWGLAFGYNPQYHGKLDSSLMNIHTELEHGGWILEDTSLHSWAKQGVLLLNTQLTTEVGSPLAHRGFWDVVVHEILKQALSSSKNILVGLNWGSEARSVMIQHTGDIHLINTSHPCKYSATAGKNPFLGSDCFNHANQILISQDIEPINWGARADGQQFTSNRYNQEDTRDRAGSRDSRILPEGPGSQQEEAGACS